MNKEQGEGYLSDGKMTPQQEWDRIAYVFDEHHENCGSAIRNEYYDPAIKQVLGDVTGKIVLDAGSGNGYFTQQLAKVAKRVIGIDTSPNMVAIATSRNVHPNTDYHVADLLEQLPLEDASIDVAVSNLVFQYIPSVEEPSAELSRVLKQGGRFIMSIEHPIINTFYRAQELAGIKREHDFEQAVGYFDRVPTLRRKLDSQARVTVFHRPLQDYIVPFLGNKFTLTNFLEPQITDAVVKIHPSYAKIQEVPRIAVMEFTKK